MVQIEDQKPKWPLKKASELRGKSKDELTKQQLNEFKQELNNLRVAKVSGSGALQVGTHSWCPQVNRPYSHRHQPNPETSRPTALQG